MQEQYRDGASGDKTGAKHTALCQADTVRGGWRGKRSLTENIVFPFAGSAPEVRLVITMLEGSLSWKNSEGFDMQNNAGMRFVSSGLDATVVT